MAAPLWYRRLTWLANSALGWFDVQDVKGPLAAPPPKRGRWLIALMVLLLPVTCIYLLICGFARLVLNAQQRSQKRVTPISASSRRSPSLSSGSSSGPSLTPGPGPHHLAPASSTSRPAPVLRSVRKLAVLPFEWAIANTRAEELMAAGQTENPPKLSRKDNLYWNANLTAWLSALEFLSPEAAQRRATELLFSRQGMHAANDNWGPGDPLSVHSFEFLLENGRLVAYATAVHSEIAHGASSRLKWMENAAGQVKVKKVTSLGVVAGRGTTEVSAHKNFLVQQHLNLAIRAERRPIRQPAARRDKYITLGKAMDGDLKAFFSQRTNPVIEEIKQSPIKLLMLFRPVILQLIDLHDPTTAPAAELAVGRYLHIDIKPGNILIKKVPRENRYELSLTDFDGVMRIPPDREDYTHLVDRHPGVIIRTRGYFGRESGEPGQPGQPIPPIPHGAKFGTYTDIYALAKSMQSIAERHGITLMTSLEASIFSAVIRNMTNQDYQRRPSAEQMLVLLDRLAAIEGLPTVQKQAALQDLQDRLRAGVMPQAASRTAAHRATCA